jgi:hypothetical protein
VVRRSIEVTGIGAPPAELVLERLTSLATDLIQEAAQVDAEIGARLQRSRLPFFERLCEELPGACQAW